MANEYKLEGNNILSDKGKVVASLTDDGSFSMAPGMAGPHSRGVREFLERRSTEEYGEVRRSTEEKEEVQADTEEYGENCVDDIPEDMLPELSPEFGIYTESFQVFIKKHKLTESQIASLVKRLSK